MQDSQLVCYFVMPYTPIVLVNVSTAGCKPFPALLCSNRVMALEYWAGYTRTLHGTDQMSTLLQHWTANSALLKVLCTDVEVAAAIAERGMPLHLFHVHTPVMPRQVFCTIGNYRCQLVESALDADDGPGGPLAPSRRAAIEAEIVTRRRSGEPYVCLKSNVSVAGAYDELCVPPDLHTLDWEVEIGVVIGRPAWQVRVDEAFEYIAGYCVVNDITLREQIFRQEPKAFGTDWLQSKSRPGWLPTGPWLVPSWSAPESTQFRPWLRLNGELMQSGSASDMVFNIDEQIAYISRHTRLDPGDLVCTGSPAGFGSHFNRYLRPGDVVEAGVDGLGAQRVLCISQNGSQHKILATLPRTGTSR